MRARFVRIALAALSVLVLAPAAWAGAPSQTVKGNVTLTTSVSNSHVLMPGNGSLHLAIDLLAADATSAARLPMNVALVIDRSGSMRGEKMDQTKAAALHFVGQLTARDTLAIISYASDVRVDLPAGPLTEDNRERAEEAIKRITAGGSTNLSGGLFRGQEEVERNLKSGQVNRVLLMSDGLANRGVTDTKQLSRQVQQSSQRGLSVTTFGVGTDYNEDMMTAVADHGGGNYYFIQRSNEIAGVFSTELSRMFATVAQQASVELMLEDGVDLKQVFGYTFTRRGDVVSVPLAEIFGGQRRSILMEVQVPVVRTGAAIIGKVTLKYADVLSEGEQRTAELELSVEVTKDSELVQAGRNKVVEERVGEVEVATTMTRAANLLREGRGGEARRLIQEQQTRTGERAASVGGSARLQQQVQQLEALDTAFEEAEAEPAAAPAAVLRAKEQAHTLAR